MPIHMWYTSKELQVSSYTKPSRPISKGREASEGEQLYFVDKAFNLHVKKYLITMIIF